MNIKFDMEQCRSLQIEQSKRDDEIVKKGFIGNDGKHHEYEYDEKNHICPQCIFDISWHGFYNGMWL